MRAPVSGQLTSSDSSIRHCGDQRSGSAAGNDEQIIINLHQVHPAVSRSPQPSPDLARSRPISPDLVRSPACQVHPAVSAIGIVINSYSGQELDDVAGCSCHLFDPATARSPAHLALIPP